MTSKGQITIPKDVREALGLEPGTKLAFVRVGPGDYRLRAKTLDVMALRGIVRYDGPPISIEEMDDAVGKAVGEANR